jgi:hypothetical protein
LPFAPGQEGCTAVSRRSLLVALALVFALPSTTHAAAPAVDAVHVTPVDGEIHTRAHPGWTLTVRVERDAGTALDPGEWWVTDAAGTTDVVASADDPLEHVGYDSAPEAGRVRAYHHLDAGEALAEVAEGSYLLHFRARVDGVAQVRAFPVRVDRTAPGLTFEPLAAARAFVPATLGGMAPDALGDADEVRLEVWAWEDGDWWEERGLRILAVRDGRWSEEDAFPEGRYLADVERCDAAWNCTQLSEEFEVGPPPPPPVAGVLPSPIVRVPRPASRPPAWARGPTAQQAVRSLADGAAARIGGRIAGVRRPFRLDVGVPFPGMQLRVCVMLGGKATAKACLDDRSRNVIARGGRVPPGPGSTWFTVRPTRHARRLLAGRRQARVRIIAVQDPRTLPAVAAGRSSTLRR